MDRDAWIGALAIIGVFIIGILFGVSYSYENKDKDPAFYIKRMGKCEDGGHMYIFEKTDVDKLFKDALGE